MIQSRLEIAEYFDSVVNEIDLFTEKKLQHDETGTPEDWWNTRRESQIEEVRRIERACLSRLNKIKSNQEEIRTKKAFVEYCFTVEFGDLLFLAKANRYVDPKEIGLFKFFISSNEANLLVDKQKVILRNYL